MERRTVVYSGDVQGVGFRYRTLELSYGRQVSGYVRNLANGTVELVVEGSADELDGFLAAVARRMAGHITDVRVTNGPATGEFATFEIRR